MNQKSAKVFSNFMLKKYCFQMFVWCDFPHRSIIKQLASLEKFIERTDTIDQKKNHINLVDNPIAKKFDFSHEVLAIVLSTKLNKISFNRKHLKVFKFKLK